MHWLLALGCTTTLGLMGIAAALAYTKPTKASWDAFIGKYRLKRSELLTLPRDLLYTEHYDLFVCRIAAIKRNGQRGDAFVGVFGNWFSAKDIVGNYRRK